LFNKNWKETLNSWKKQKKINHLQLV